MLFDEKISDEKYFREIKGKVKNKVQVDVNHVDVDNMPRHTKDDTPPSVMRLWAKVNLSIAKFSAISTNSHPP